MSFYTTCVDSCVTLFIIVEFCNDAVTQIKATDRDVLKQVTALKIARVNETYRLSYSRVSVVELVVRYVNS